MLDLLRIQSQFQQLPTRDAWASLFIWEGRRWLYVYLEGSGNQVKL